MSRFPNDEENMVLEVVKNKINNYKQLFSEKRLSKVFEAQIMIEEDYDKWGSGVVAWTSFNTIKIKKYVIDLEDTFIYQILAHELVHLKQYSNIWSIIWYRTFGRFSAEKEAYSVGIAVEKWVKNNK